MTTATTQTIPLGSYRTIKAARADGYRNLRYHEYGGDQIAVRGRTLVRNPKQAQSKTWWKKAGYSVKAGEEPHATRAFMLSGGWVEYGIYRDDQVEPCGDALKRRRVRGPRITRHGIYIKEGKRWNTKGRLQSGPRHANLPTPTDGDSLQLADGE